NVFTEAHGKGQADREAVARDRARALDSRLARVAISLAPATDAPGLEIRRDGQVVSRTLWGVEIPVDRGDHRVDAVAPGYLAFAKVVRIEDGQRVRIDVPVLARSSEPLAIDRVPAREEKHVPTSALVMGGVAGALAGIGIL